MKQWMTLCLILFFGTVLTAQNNTKKEQIVQLYTEVDHFLKEGETESARMSLEKLLKLDKSNRSNLYLALGGMAEQQLDTGKAIKYYKKSISSDKKSHTAYYSMGALYFNQGVEILETIPFDEQTQRVAATRKGLDFLKKALPYLEQGFRLSDDRDIYEVPLNTVYRYLNLASKTK